MTLGQKQERFAHLLAVLILEAERRGFKVRIGEVERSQAAADAMAAAGKGIRKSLHRLRLAVDLHLFRDGVYLTATEDHRELGEWWEAQDPLARWGGRFGDGNHYGLEHEGVK